MVVERPKNEWKIWYQEHRDPSIEVTTILDDIIKLDPTKFRSTKYYTNDCPGCPFFVPPIDAEEFIEALRQHKKAIGDSFSGICCYYQNSAGDIVGKALVQNQHNRTRNCTIGKDKIKKRASERIKKSILSSSQ